MVEESKPRLTRAERQEQERAANQKYWEEQDSLLLLPLGPRQPRFRLFSHLISPSLSLFPSCMTQHPLSVSAK
jgi:hypothetical protein